MIDDPDLLMFLQNEETRAVDTTLNDERATALAFYRGDKFGDEVEGRSQLRTRDVAEVVDYAVVTVMRTMISGEKIVEFEPLSPMMVDGEPGEDGQPAQKDMASEYAQEASERVHWNFLREQDGYTILQDGVKAGLLEKSGVWKSWIETPHEFVPQRLNAAEIDARDDVINAEPADDLFDLHEETGEPLQVYDAMVRVPGKPQFRDAAVPNEEFFVSPDARTLDTAAYLGNLTRISLAQLVEMGYEWEDVENLWGDAPGETQGLSDARDAGRGNTERDVARRDWNRIVVLREEYCRWFFEGRYQLVRVHRVGTKILSVVAAPMQPYTLWCPFPMQHRLIGNSLADKVLDIQVVRSHMLRQAMDALYLANTPRLAIDMANALPETIDDALDVAPGGLIRYKGTMPMPLAIPFVGGNAFSAMEIMAAEKENRTGITRMNRGLSADALNTETATEFRGLQEGGQQIEEYIARNCANAVGELFEKKLKLMRAHMEAHPFKIDGEFRDLNPQAWPEDMRIGVRVGLGTGNKDKRLRSLQMLAEAMDDAGERFGLVSPENAFNAAKALAGTLSVGPATQFFTDPATKKDEPPKPDPAQQEMEAKQQQAAMDMQMRQQEAAAKLDLMRQESAARLQLERDKAAQETDLARERMAAEFQLKREQMMFTAQTNANLSQDRPGGRLDA